MTIHIGTGPGSAYCGCWVTGDDNTLHPPDADCEDCLTINDGTPRRNPPQIQPIVQPANPYAGYIDGGDFHDLLNCVLRECETAKIHCEAHIVQRINTALMWCGITGLYAEACRENNELQISLRITGTMT